jgi:site-specific DNA-methyltransferase (adenine-specific)
VKKQKHVRMFDWECGTLPFSPELETMVISPAFSTNRGAVYNADCFALFSALKDGCIDAVFADPPFNLGKDYGRGADKDVLDRDAYLRWCYRWIDEAVRVTKPGGAVFIYNLPQWSFHLAAYLETKCMTFRHWIALSMKGTFPRGKKLYPAHYALLYFTKGDPKTFNRDQVRQAIPLCRHCGRDIKDYGGHRKYLNPLGLNLTDFWEDTSPARHQKDKARWHVNELKPMIPGRCIELSTNETDVVLDPFGGGGSTFEAAQTLNRYWIGTEIVDCDLIRRRFERNLSDVKQSAPSALTKLFRSSDPKLRIDLAAFQKLLTTSGTTAPKSGLNGSASLHSLRRSGTSSLDLLSK